MQTGERVQVGEVACLAEPSRVLDRGSRARRERLEFSHVVLVEFVAGLPGEDREVSQRTAVDEHRHCETGVDECVRVLRLELRVRVADRDRSCDPPIRRTGDRMAFSFLDGKTERGDDRLSFDGIREHHERSVRFVESAGGLERPRQHLVEVDRAGELAEDPASSSFFLGALECRRELGPQLVHARVEARHDLRDPLLGRRLAPQPEHEQAEQQERERSQAR